MSDNNGNNGGNKSAGRTPLDRVRERISARQLTEEQGSGVVSVGNLALEEIAPDSDNDPLYAWKKREDGAEPTLQQLHNGLIAVAEISEASIESGINTAADLHKALSAIVVTKSQVAAIAAKTEVNAHTIDEVDEDIARMGKVLKAVRKDVQSVKEDMAEVKAATLQIPAIKEILGEIMARLPSPRVKKRRKRRSV